MPKSISLPVVQTGLENSITQGVKKIGTVNIPVSVDPSAFKNLAQPLGKVSGLATEFEKSIAASNARVLAFGASVGIINGVQNAFADLLKTGIEVQKTLADIAAISGQGGKELSKFGDALFDVGKLTGQSFKTASQAALEFSRQGLSVEETLKRTTDALTLTRFTSLNAAEAVDVLTAATNSFADTGITTSQIINKLVAVDTKFAVSAEDLAKGLARAGSIAQEVGVNFDELNAAVTVAQERTARGGAVIGNALKTIFTRLRSDETVQALRDIGIESLNAQGQLKGAIPLLKELSDKLQGLSGGERVQILEAVASKYNINILSALLNDLNSANSKFSEAVGISAGASNQAYERQIELNKTLAAQLNQVSVSVTQLFNKLSEIGVTDNLATLLKFVNDLVNGFNKLLDSEGIGGNIARGLVKGISDVFFTVGLPIIAAIFVKLTRDIAQFGVESLKTILGINQQVRERQALEQAVVNTLIRDQEVMATILSLSGSRAKQEEYLLGVYNRQLAALQQVQNIAAGVAPALMAGGLTATSGQIKKRGAGGYLPAQEAADVRRGVGGASPSSKVVSIPNFAFGGGKRGTMVANTSEYIVPNFANGGSAIFNKDMAKKYGLPAGARKISAAGGYVPNFARYVYDSDRIEPDKNALLKAILASKAKKNVIIGPAGSGKSTYGASLGQFIANVGQLADATEIDILSAASRTKDGGVSKNFQQILDAVNLSGGKVSYLYTGNMDIYSRRAGRVEKGSMEGDLRTGKELSRTFHAPMNQFDFISKVKRGAKNFEMLRGAEGFIPNFAAIDTDRFAALVGKKSNGILKRESRWVSQDKDNKINVNSSFRPSNPNEINGKLVNFNVYGVPSSSEKEIEDIKKDLSESGKVQAVRLAQQMTGNALPSDLIQAKLAATFNPGSLSSFAGTIFEASVGSLLGDKSFKDYSEQTVTSAFDLNIAGNQKIKDAFNIHKEVEALEVKGSDTKTLMDGVAKKIYQVTEGQREAFSKRKIGYNEAKTLGMSRPLSNLSTLEVFETIGGKQQSTKFNSQGELENYLSTKYTKTFGNSIVAGSGQWSGKGSMGYVPNFALNPLTDAINREMAAGLNPSQIRVTQDGRLRNAANPSGIAVINTRDEPNGKIPNFAKKLTLETQKQTAARLAQSRAEPMFQSAQRQTIEWEPSPGSVARPMGGGDVARPMGGGDKPSMPVSYQKWSDSFDETAGIAKKLGESMKNGNFGMDKMFYAFSGITAASGILEEAFKDSKTETAANVRAGSAIAQGAASGAMALSMFGPYGMIAGGLVGGALAGYKEGVQPLEIQKQQQQEMMKAELSPQGATAEEKIKNLEKTIAFRKNLETRLTRDAANSSIEAGGMFSSQQGASELMDQAKASAEQRARLTQELEKQKKILDEQKQKEAEIKKEVENRIALSSVIGKLNVEYAKGQATAAVNIANQQAAIITASTSLTQEQKLQREERQKVYELEQKIEAVQGETLHTLLKQIASQSKLANVKKEDLAKLQEKFNKGEKINLEDEAKKLGIRDYSQLAAALQSAKETSEIRTIELNSEKKRLQTAIDANKFNREKTAELTAQLRLVEYSYDIEKKMQELRTSDARAEKSFAKGSRLRQLKNESSYRGYNTRQQQRELDYQQSIYEYDEKSQAIFDDTLTAKRKNLDLAKDAIKAEVTKVKALNEQAGLVDRIQRATTEKELLAIRQDLAEASGVDKTNLETFNQILENQLRSLREKDRLSEKDYNRQIELLGLNPRDSEANFRRKLGTTFKGGMYDAFKEISIEASSFSEDFGKTTTLAFRDGMRDAMSAAISQTDDLGAALQDVAKNFLKTMQNMFLQNAANNAMLGLQNAFPSVFPKLAKGGVVSGGSGYRDDVPAMLMGGEFVMRKSAVQKYGVSNLQKMNTGGVPAFASGGIFLPGVRGGGAISGYKDLTAFANQITTSGATDVLKGGGSSAFANLEDQSSRLSRYALTNPDDLINQEIRSAQEQALNIIAEREKYRTEQRKAFQSQLKQTVASAALSYGINAGVGKLGSLFNRAAPVPKELSNLINDSGFDYSNFGNIGYQAAGKTVDQVLSFGNFADGAAGVLKSIPSYQSSAATSSFQNLMEIVPTSSFQTPRKDPLALLSRQMDKPGMYLTPRRVTMARSPMQGLAESGFPYGTPRPVTRARSPMQGLAESGFPYGKRFSAGGPTDDIPALLMSGEYIMNRQSTSKYGKRMLDAMNQGRMPRFADGGDVSPSVQTTTTENSAKMMGDVNININVAEGSSKSESQGDTGRGGIDYKKMSERIKAVVLETINEEKRLGGSLRSR